MWLLGLAEPSERMNERSGTKPWVPEHEVLGLIERGSYGEVWLARSATGRFHAVKVVRRDAFPDARPFERELEGLRHYEPLSCRHAALLPILQVGLEDGRLYYVMELADDVERGQEIDPEHYTPRTLQRELKRRGRLPFDECLELGLALTEGLAFLHACGLVHRDIKPSNVIYVHGRPKLTDVGLVAGADQTMTILGTRGYVPPLEKQGPLTDVYSVGMVLYVAAFGQDVDQFPALPTDLPSYADRHGLEELNRVIVRACQPDPVQRHGSIQALREELEGLRAGQSINRLRVAERKARGWRNAVLAAVVLVVGVAMGVWVHRHWRPRLEETGRFSLPHGLHVARTLVGDWDHDGREEFFLSSKSAGRRIPWLALMDANGRELAYWEGPLDAKAWQVYAVNQIPDAHGQLLWEAVVGWRESSKVVLACLNENLRETRRFQMPAEPWDQLPGSLEQDHVRLAYVGQGERLRGGQREPVVLAIRHAGHSLRPRGVACFGLITNTVLGEVATTNHWFYETGPDVVSVLALGPAGDQPTRFLWAGAAVNNGNRGPDGTDDGQAWVGLIDADGRHVRTRAVGDALVYASLLCLRQPPATFDDVVLVLGGDKRARHRTSAGSGPAAQTEA